MGAGSSHTFFCLWLFSSSLFPFPPGSDGDIRRLMTMFHTRGWGEEDNRLVSRLDLKHTQALARRRPGQRLLPAWMLRALLGFPGPAATAAASAPPGHVAGCAPLTNAPLPKPSGFCLPPPRERFLHRGCLRSHRGAATSLLPSSLPGWGTPGTCTGGPGGPGGGRERGSSAGGCAPSRAGSSRPRRRG